MSLSWFQRKKRLASLLKSQGDEDADGLALDRILHGQNVIGKTSKTTEIDALRFQDKDLAAIGTLEYGQFGVIYVVTCRLDGRVYVRKSIEKRFALRNRDQCFPQFERDILLRATKTGSSWAPHLLCAFQTPTHLNLVMHYAEGGNLWDVLESSPHNGKVLECDLRWWTPQIVSAIQWCHSQGFVHRDIKPHNFVLTPTAHVLLIDFGSAAPLLPPNPDGTQFLPKRYCLIPCGTCDYISPEILRAHEEALVALEMESDDDGDDDLPPPREADEHGYGRETDWWSLGAMLYEMAYGFAPFFAKDIRQTYLRIMDHEKSLRFDLKAALSAEYRDFLGLLLTKPERRLGRRHIQEITNHALFEDVNWNTLTTQTAPSDLHLPSFTYAEPANLTPVPSLGEDIHSQGFNFSALFQSTVASSSPGLSVLLSRSSHPPRAPEDDTTASFIGFSWGPKLNAFPIHDRHEPSDSPPDTINTPRPVRFPATYITPNANFITPRWSPIQTDPIANRYTTPLRPTTLTPFQTLQRTGTTRPPTLRRNVSDREAMKQLVNCVGMSARKKVLESGRKPRILTSFSLSGSLKKDLNFVIPLPDYSNASNSNSNSSRDTGTLKQPTSTLLSGRPKPILIIRGDVQNGAFSSSEDTTDSEGPPSPSPTPRPGSSMSILSTRRAGTPTVGSMRMVSGGMTMTSGMSTMLLGVPRSASVRSMRSSSLSFSRSFGEGVTEMSSALLPDWNSDPGKTKSNPRIEEMERRLERLVEDVKSLEGKLGRFKQWVK